MPDSSSTTARVSAAPPASSGGMSAPPIYSPDTDIHILDRLAVLYRYRRIAIAVFVLTTAAMMIQGYTTEKKYRA